jgi:hypothetical protein
LGGHAIEGDLDAIIFYPIASTIKKWRAFTFLRRMENFHHERSWTYIQDLFESLVYLTELLIYGSGGIFKLLMWMQKLHQSTWDVCADKSSEGE